MTIKTKNFPADDSFTVRMGKYGTLGIGGKVVATTDSGDWRIVYGDVQYPGKLERLCSDRYPVTKPHDRILRLQLVL